MTYKNFNSDAFRDDIRKAKSDGLFEPVFEAADEGAAYDIFEKVYTSILSRHSPLKVIQNRSNYVPYIDKDLKNLMNVRDELKEEAAKTGDVRVFEDYKEKRNLVSTKLKHAESEHHKSKLGKSDLSPSDIWQGAKQILGSFKSNFPTQILAGGKPISNPLKMAVAVNEYFLEKIVKLKNDNATVNQNDATDVLENFLSDKDIPNDGFDLKELSEEDVLKLIKNIKGKKSCGLDWICGHSQK